MIPRTLQIKNFLSYGSELQTIDFSPYHLIYLSGKNGHGKSALLDAITWAIWGNARKVSTAVKADQGLLRLGQTQMIVILDFELERNLYRVRREFTHVYGKATTTLEFGLINPETNEFIPLTDKTLKATQAKIEQTMRLDYTAFTNSAFLRQGHANEFSQKSPKERKEILGSILGLQQFDTIKKRALEKAKEAQNKQQALRQLEETYIQELGKKEELDKALKTVHETFTLNEKKERDLAKIKKILEKERAQITEHSKQRELIAYKCTQQHKTLDEKKAAINSMARQWRSIHRKQRTLPDIKKLHEQRTQLAASIMQHHKQLQEHLKLKESALKTQAALQEKKNNLHNEFLKQKHALHIEYQRHKLEHASAEKTLKECESKKKELIKVGKTITPELIQKTQLQFEKRKEFYQQCISDGKWYTSERTNLLQKTQLVHDDDPSCPLCEQNLSIARRKFLKNQFNKQQQFIEHRLQRLTRIVTTLKPLLIQEHAHLEQCKLDLQKAKELTQLENQSKEANTLIALLLKKIKEQETLLAAHDKKEQTSVSNDPDIKQLTAQIATIQKQLNQTSYNEQTHIQNQKNLESIEKQINELQELQQQILNQQERKETISQLVVDAKKIKLLCVQLEQEKKQFDGYEKQKQELEKKEAEYAHTTQTLTKEKEQLIEQRGSLENQRSHLTKIEAELKKQEKIITDLNQIIDDYQTIASATGKDGIQALLIEEAIPEIEQEANALLSKLTNNQAQIFIESLRDLKKGGSKETLDIKISDPSGIRSYELFSGGEAFRIDFALRIAISKLLARRAGTALQTLIIDEGFGSQDEEGLSHIMDAIYRIQDDFEKVIVVSHLPSMRDQFPVHFMVEKGATGSQIQIVEQG